MATIMCVQHHNCEAIYLCKLCGFVCEKHAKELSTKNHTLLVLKESIQDLYNAMANKAKLLAESTLISLIKLKIIAFLDNEKAAVLRLLKDAQKIVNMALADDLGMDAQKLNATIIDSINLSQPSTTKINAKRLNDFTECIIKGYNKHIHCVKQTTQVLYENSINLYMKWDEKEWDSKYQIITSKWTLWKNPNITISEKIMKNGTERECKMNKIGFAKKELGNEGAFTIGYALRKNTALQTLSIISYSYEQQ